MIPSAPWPAARCVEYAASISDGPSARRCGDRWSGRIQSIPRAQRITNRRPVCWRSTFSAIWNTSSGDTFRCDHDFLRRNLPFGIAPSRTPYIWQTWRMTSSNVQPFGLPVPGPAWK